MPFFLLSRDDNDGLRLLTDKTWPSRQAALAELSRLTADPGFDAWDTDVVLVDLDSATPVLMVRPAGDAAVESMSTGTEGTQPAPEPEDLAALAEDVYVAEADMPSDVVVEPLGVIPADEAEAFAAYVSPAEDAETTEISIEQAAPVSEMATELAPEPEVEAALADFEPVSGFAAVGEDEGDDLREALERTTAAMAEEAHAEEPAQTVETAAPSVAEKWPWDAVAAAEPVEAAPSVEGPTPVSEPAQDATAVSAFLSDLEPIVPSEPVSEAVAAEPVAETATPEAEPTPAPEPEPEPEPEPVVEAAQTPAPEPEPVAEPSPQPEPQAQPAEVSTVDEYVCADCVYYETCPNKDERLPKNCGSFQWK